MWRPCTWPAPSTSRFPIGAGPSEVRAAVLDGKRGFELGAVLVAILIANYVTQDGESNWFEGVQLLALYAVLGLVFYFA